MIMKGCVQWNPVYGWEDFALRGDQTQTARSVGQILTHWATGAPDSEGSLSTLVNLYLYLHLF